MRGTFRYIFSYRAARSSRSVRSQERSVVGGTGVEPVTYWV